METIHELTSEGGPLRELITQVKVSNDLTRRNQKALRLALFLLLVCTTLTILVALFLNSMASRVTTLQTGLDEGKGKISSLEENSQITREKVEEVKVQTDEIATEQATQPKVELIQETDPKKAVSAPIKVRITPRVPSSADAAPPARVNNSVIEVPVQLKDAHVMPSASVSAPPPPPPVDGGK